MSGRRPTRSVRAPTNGVRHDHHAAGRGGAGQCRAGRQVHRVDGIGYEVNDEDKARNAANDAQTERLDHAAAIVAQSHAQRCSFDAARFHGPLEDRRLRHFPAQVVADRAKQEAAEERDAPSPGVEVGGAEARGQQRRGQRTCERADLCAELLPASGQAPLARRRILDQERRCAAPFPTSRETLQQAAQHKQNRRPRTDGLVSRDQSDRTGRTGHQPDRYHQGGSTSQSITVGADNDGANRAHQERGTECRVGAIHGARWIEGPRYGDGEVAVDGKVEQLKEIADGAGQDGAAAHHGKLGRLERGKSGCGKVGHNSLLLRHDAYSRHA